MSKTQSLTKRTWQPSVHGDYTFADIHELLAFVQHEIHASGRTYTNIAAKAGCCNGTVSKLARGDTKFPRAQTVLDVLRTLGFTIVVRD